MRNSKRQKNPDNRGITLMELIVVIAIIGVFTGVLGRYIMAGSGLFRSVSGTTQSQMDSQEAADALEDLILDANKAIYYNHVNDMSESQSSDGGILTIIRLNSAGKAVKDVITYDSTAETLSLSRTVTDPPASGGGDGASGTSSGDQSFENSVLAYNIVDFAMDASKAEDGIVRFTLTAENNNKQVTVKRSVSLRNTIKMTDSLDEAFSEAAATATPVPGTT